MEISHPSLATIRDLMAGRIIGLDQHPGVYPVGIKEAWLQSIPKHVLVVARAEAKEACSTEHICGGLETGINSRIHATQILW